MSKNKELVRDGFLGDLPEEIQLKLMSIHKLIVNTCDEVWKDPAYDPIRNIDWAKTAIEEFCTQPSNNSQVGSVRVYKQGKRNSCMIQITGHFINHRNDIDHELLHDFIRHVHQDMRSKVRRQYDMRLTCESEHGEPFEGFDVWPSSKVAKVIWNLFEDKNTKVIKESSAQIACDMLAGADDSIGDDDIGGIKGTHNVNDAGDSMGGDMVMMGESTRPYTEMMFIEKYELPDRLQEFIENLNSDIVDKMIRYLNQEKYNNLIENYYIDTIDMLTESYQYSATDSEIGDTILYKDNNDRYFGSIVITNECEHPDAKKIYYNILQECKIVNDPTKTLVMNENIHHRYFTIELDHEYAKRLWNYLENHNPEYFEEMKTREEYNIQKFKQDYDFNPIDNTINVDGKRVKVNINKLNKEILSITNGDEEIILGNNFFNLKNKARRDAVLQHEIGHLKMHRANFAKHNQLGNQKFGFSETDNDAKESIKEDLIRQGITPSNEIINKILEDFRYKIFLMNRPDELSHYDPKNYDKDFLAKREEARQWAYKKYLKNNQSDHTNLREFEADRYATNRVSESDLKHALHNIVKQYKNKLRKEDNKNKIMIDMQDDINKRSKALKDQEMKKKLSYIESSSDDILFDPFLEANNPKPEYNTDMTEAEAKRTLRTLSQNMMNDISNKKGYKVSQYTANIYANIITKNLLPIWGKGFRKFTITLDSYQSFNTFEFKAPKMTQDFVSRFIEGRESINGLIHRIPEINVRMSPKIFHTMKNPDDAFNFFRAAIKYYSDGLEKYSDKLMSEAMKLNHELKHLISTTKLSGIVTCPMQLLFVFDDVKMDDKDTFKISQSDIKTVNQFIRNIYTRYAAPEKEKKQIVDDINEMIKALKEACDNTDENIRHLSYLPEAVESYLSGEFDTDMNNYHEKWITESLDMDWIHKQKNPEVKYLQEKFGVKKLKKFPADLIAYITIETEAIKDANDKMMIASYTIGKLELVEWYISLIDCQSKKYIVPHTRPYLETLRTNLLACYKKIMEVKIVNPNDRPLLDIKYPKGYEG